MKRKFSRKKFPIQSDLLRSTYELYFSISVRHESLQSSSGKIFYEPDAADDFDEEDPDDDLDV